MTTDQPPNNRILVIDDNQAIHADFKKILQPADPATLLLEAAGSSLFGQPPAPAESAGFALDTALSGEDGLALVTAARAQGRPYALAFVDVRMAPGWDGIETTHRICQADPDIQIVICTAYSDYSWEEMIARLGQSDRLVILKKPFDTIEVLQLTHVLAQKWDWGQTARARLDQLTAMVATRTAELQTANEKLKIEMEERSRTEVELRQAQKMEAVGQLAGGIAHDFNNLLTVIRGYTECLNAEMPRNPKVLEALREIDAAAERAARLTAQMLMFSRKKRLQPQSVSLPGLITQFGAMLGRLLGEHITMELSPGDLPLTLHADPVMIEMVILNLALNARDAMPKGGRLQISACACEITTANVARHPQGRPGTFACLTVADTGCGIAEVALPHLFEPFFTTKEPGQGTGLGLASAYGIVKQHQGWIEVESQPGQGARFHIYLPAQIPPPRPAAPPPSPPRSAGGTETILLVEDEIPVRRLAKLLLQRHGYQVFEAGSGREALTVWAAQEPNINLLLTDMIMPGGWTGRELAKRILADVPNLKIIYTTGYSPETFSADLPLHEGLNFLAKPYPPNKLLETVRRCLDEPAPVA